MALLSRNGLIRGSIQDLVDASLVDAFPFIETVPKVNASTSATAVSVSLTEEQTDALTAGRQHYAYQLRDTTADTTLAVGLMTVRAS